ncbi:MAG TPA: VOC family protein [Rubrobacter sp.]|nr:VOC family protein [Rubrobacter sp.]
MPRPPAFIDHIIIQVADLPRSLEFYRAALEPLGAEVTDIPGPPESWGPAVVLGPEDAEDLALIEGEPSSRLHLAFVAPNHEAVRKFHAAALASGGRDNGPPGVREHYNPHYYAAFAIDPDGHNVEALFQGP